MAQLRRVFVGSTHPTEWSRLGLGGKWAHRVIRPCGLASSTALGRYMEQQHFDGQAFVAGYLGFPESRDAIQYVSSHSDALCFADLNQANGQVRVIGIRLADKSGVSSGSREDIIHGRYPLDRYLFIYTKTPGSNHRAASLACQYLRMVLSPAGQDVIATAPPHYLPLSHAERMMERRRLRRTLCSGSSVSQPVVH